MHCAPVPRARSPSAIPARPSPRSAARRLLAVLGQQPAAALAPHPGLAAQPAAAPLQPPVPPPPLRCWPAQSTRGCREPPSAVATAEGAATAATPLPWPAGREAQGMPGARDASAPLGEPERRWRRAVAGSPARGPAAAARPLVLRRAAARLNSHAAAAAALLAVGSTGRPGPQRRGAAQRRGLHCTVRSRPMAAQGEA